MIIIRIIKITKQTKGIKTMKKKDKIREIEDIQEIDIIKGIGDNNIDHIEEREIIKDILVNIEIKIIKEIEIMEDHGEIINQKIITQINKIFIIIINKMKIITKDQGIIGIKKNHLKIIEMFLKQMIHMRKINNNTNPIEYLEVKIINQNKQMKINFIIKIKITKIMI